MPSGSAEQRRAPTQPLPPKEAGSFRKVVKCYEQKQFRNGLRLANQILKSHPDHGETLSMKGLILNSQGKREEARECVKRGLRSDIASHVCWHVFGLFHRSEKKYDEAIKAYRNALARDKDNMQILRDLSLLQVQMRDLEGYAETRYSLLSLRPTQRASWIGYAMSYHLLGRHDLALGILQEFLRSQTEAKKSNSFQPPSMDYEHSELLLYQNMVLREAGKTTEALAHLNEHEFAVHDKTQLLELKGQLHLAEGRPAVAAEFYRELIQRNPDNRDYFMALETCLELGREEAAEARWKLYQQMAAQFPRATVPRLRPLFFLQGPVFAAQLADFLRAGLRKGQPSLFQLVRGLYAWPEKGELVGRVVEEFRGELEASAESGSASEPPTTLLWALYFLAQHHDRLGDWETALGLVERALEHTPTLMELWTLKARVLKHAGALGPASVCATEAQSLDTADRFLNSKAAKYLLRVGRLEEAEAMAAKFTREGMEPMANLAEMQCLWFEAEEAAAFYRLGMLGHALKRCHEMERHFADIEEDQFDFHTYCVRKMTLTAYVRLLRLEDSLRAHPFYFKAANLAAKIYLRLHDAPAAGGAKGGAAAGGPDDASALSAEERKRERKEKKAKAKAEAEAKEAAAKAQANRKPEKKVEADEGSAAVAPLDPATLLATKAPLDQAVSFLTPLLDLNTGEIDAYVLGFHVYWRKEKVLRMTQCLRRAHDLQPLHPKLHVCKLQMLMFVEGREWDGAVGQVVEEQLGRVFGAERSPLAHQEAFVRETAGSFPHLMAAVEGGVALRDWAGWGKAGPGAKARQEGATAELLKALLSAVEPGRASPPKGRSLAALLRARKLLDAGRLGPQDPLVLERFRRAAAELFPLAEALREAGQPPPDHASLRSLPRLLHHLRLNDPPNAHANGQAD